MAVFVDTHCHLDAPEFGDEMPAIRARAAEPVSYTHLTLPTNREV